MLGCINFWTRNEESMKGKTRMWPGDRKMQIALLAGCNNKQRAHHYAMQTKKQKSDRPRDLRLRKTEGVSPWRLHYLAGVWDGKMANVKRFASVLRIFACTATPLSRLRLKCPASLLCVRFSQMQTLWFWFQNFLVLFCDFSLFSVPEEEDQVLHTNALAFESDEPSVFVWVLFMFCARNLFAPHHKSQLSERRAQKKDGWIGGGWWKFSQMQWGKGQGKCIGKGEGKSIQGQSSDNASHSH